MNKFSKYLALALITVSLFGCNKVDQPDQSTNSSAAEILGNPNYPAISYGGYREKTRDDVPTVKDLKEDMQILFAMGVRILRTYNASQFPQAERILKAISELKKADPNFEMYVMLGLGLTVKMLGLIYHQFMRKKMKKIIVLKLKSQSR